MTRFKVLCAWLAVVLTGAASPSSAQPAKTTAIPGLVAEASEGSRSVTFVALTPNFTLGEAQSVHPQLGPDFKVEFSGFLSVLRGGKYTLAGNAKIFIDGREVQGQPIELEAGERPIRVVYQRAAGKARLQVAWESAFFKTEPIPASAFLHREESAELASQRKADRGHELVEELNCTACHVSAKKIYAGRRGPDLSAMGDRASAAWIFKWLENPRHFRSTAAMPAMLADAQERADVAAYLASVKSAQPAAALIADPAAAAKGKELFTSLGCVGCHGDTGHALTGMGSKISLGELAKYLRDPLAVDPSGRMPGLALSEGEAVQLAAYLVESRNADFEKAPPTGNALRGRSLVESSGCVNCHTVADKGGALVSSLTAPAFEKLSAGQGCLSATPPTKAPRYALSATDRESLGAYLLRPDISEAPVQDFHRATKALQCGACHELNAPAKLSFGANQAPPSLTDAGNKLRASWLVQVLQQKKRVRPWMALRMPHYGETATASLVHGFAAQAGAELGEGELIPAATPEQIQGGAKLLGMTEGGLSCINCHDFNGKKSQGEMRGPDMTEMYARCRADWLRRWLREPSRIQAGTAMPAFFTDMPEDKSTPMIESIVRALSAGKDIPLPGAAPEPMIGYVLKVTDEPIVLRTFLQEAHPRAIAVGLPGGQSYCFDATDCRVRYAWSGDFLDAKPVWGDRGGQPAALLGVKWFTAADVFPLRIGRAESLPKVKFRGYRLEKKFPVFLYDVDGVAVSEKVTVSASGRGIVREFEIKSPGGDVWFLGPLTPGVTFSSSAGPFVLGKLKIPAAPTVRFAVETNPN